MKISVTLANYNHGRFLETYFAGIRGQTYQNWELIVTDDGSTDNSREIIRRHAAEDRRIKVHEFPKNRGSLPAFQNCYKRVTGELVYATASDDYVLDLRFFAKAVKAFKWQPKLGLFFGTEEIRDATSGHLYGVDGRAPNTGYLPPADCVDAFLEHKLLVPGCAAIVRKACIDEFGGFPADLGPNCDYYLNHAIAGKYGAHFEKDLFAYARLDLKHKNLSLRMPLAQRLFNIHEIARRFKRDGLFKTIRAKSLREWLTTEVRNAITGAYDGLWTLKYIRDLHRGCQHQHGLSEEFRTVLFGRFIEDVSALEQSIAAEVLKQVAEFDRGIRVLAPGYRTPIREQNFSGVFGFVEQRPDLRTQIATKLAKYAKAIRKHSPIVLYGTGTHSVVLIEEWKKRRLPAFSAVTTTDTKGGGDFQGIPIVALDSLDDPNQLVVLSSHTFENQMFEALQQRVRPSAVLGFWNPGLTNL